MAEATDPIGKVRDTEAFLAASAQGGLSVAREARTRIL